jgi:hypothetical protein
LDSERQKSVSYMAPSTSKDKTAFRLPSDVSLEKQCLCGAWAYVFRHRVLGELGRILLQELGDGRCHLSCEAVGDPADPMTAQRLAASIRAAYRQAAQELNIPLDDIRESGSQPGRKP